MSDVIDFFSERTNKFHMTCSYKSLDIGAKT